jgi:murein L,D-transpeptidase YafK
VGTVAPTRYDAPAILDEPAPPDDPFRDHDDNDDIDATAAPPVDARERELSTLPARIEAPRIVVWKEKRELAVYSKNTVLRRYKVGLGLDPVRPKSKKGDDATPEGTYYVCRKNPQSRYDKALALSYPGPQDAERGRAAGLITDAEYRRILDAWSAKQPPPFDTALGGDVCIHGAGSSWDWTQGCIALNFLDIEELYRVIPLGTSVEIRP